MVQLSFLVRIEKDFQTVWSYFSLFTNITKWDPNTTGCVPIKQLPERIGSQYRVTSLFNGKESDLIYKLQKITKTENEGYISLMGENDLTTAFDEIICKRKGPNTTEMEYRADICLRGLAVLVTPFIICSLNKLTQNARNGCVNKARQLWGKAEVVI